MLDNILHWIDNSISPQVHRYRAATQGKLCQYTQLTMEWTCLDHYTTKYANVSTKFKEPLFGHLINSLIINIISLEQNPLVYMEVNVNLPINNKLKRCKGIVQRKHSTHRPNITKMICSIPGIEWMKTLHWMDWKHQLLAFGTDLRQWGFTGWWHVISPMFS